jgi:hypothetical protein
MAYELWSTASGTLLQTSATEQAALRTVLTELAARGQRYAEAFALGYEDARGRSRPIAQGTALSERALQAAAA